MANIPNYLTESLEQMARNYDTQYQTAPQVQDALFKDEYHALKYQKDYRTYEEEKERVLQNYQKKTKRLETINKHLPYLKKTISDAQDDPEVLNQYETTFTKESLEKLELERWMKDNNATENNQEFMAYNMNRTRYAYYVAAGEQLAEWFATGAAGPGTVTFMGKDYTAA